MSKEGELIKIQFKNKHHEELEKTKNYKTIEFDLIPVLFKESYEKYKDCDDFIIITDNIPSKNRYLDYKNTCCTNINKHCIRSCYPFLSSSFLYYYELEKEEMIKIIKTLKELLEEMLFFNNFICEGDYSIRIGDFSDFKENCGFIDSITLKKIILIIVFSVVM